MTALDRSVRLIVNADDFNLTEGVSAGILEAHDRGIVTSTSFMVNLPAPASVINELTKRKKLGVGLHLNITLGRPVSEARRIPSLAEPGGMFRKRAELDFKRLSEAELGLEYTAQIEKFKKLLGRLPTHLDTHHHLHAEKKVFTVFSRIAARYRLPIRLSRLCVRGVREKLESRGVLTPDSLIEDLDPKTAWTPGTLYAALRALKPGARELMCHPARCDKALAAISGFNTARERELQALCSSGARAILKKKGVRLISFADL